MDTFQIIITAAICAMSLISVIVGVVIVQVLLRVKKTLDRVNTTIDLVEDRLVSFTSPLQSLAGMAGSLGAGLKIFESFTGWLNRGKKNE